jgi:hypothetical protein
MVENRPCGELALTLTMDEREWKDDKIVVEIQARGHGVIPPLEDLFDTKHEGFELETVDSRMSLTEFVTDGKQRIPHADRNWQLTYTRKPDLRGDVVFHFPTLKAGVTPASIEYKHYQDADLVVVEAAKASTGITLTSQVGNTPRNVVVLALLVLLIAIGVWLTRRRKTTRSIATQDLTIPTDPTPFSTVAFLRRIRTNHAPQLSDTDKAALTAQIDEIEASYFSGAKAPSLDLPAIIGKWHGLAKR